MELEPPSSVERQRTDEEQDSNKRQCPDNKPRRTLPLRLLAELSEFVKGSTDLAKEQGENMQTVLQQVSISAANAYTAYQLCVDHLGSQHNSLSPNTRYERMLTRDSFASYSVDTIEPLLIELKSQEPALFAVTEGVRESFFRFVQDRQSLENLPEEAMKGMGMKKADREKLTTLELVLPEPVVADTLNPFRKTRTSDVLFQAPIVEEIEEGSGKVAGDDEMIVDEVTVEDS